ncbi:DUF1045 domain-containing protein [Roseibium aestuarii]|uniref:DUF1045 domain-containing protein n=1 Tax=Roseibium aestuarii TaxID=2600299 RepID=A0ABW4JZJ9_9HYPH|nr:DUF1045 domain-containing protein [Roseibium aestuarii]
MRYALYFALARTSPLMQLGNGWLGRDPFDGKALSQPAIPGMAPSRFAELTTDPRRYGFHGTLRAPFHVKPEISEQDLLKAAVGFAARTAPFTTTGFKVAALGRFLALVPAAPDAALNGFADACVEALEPLRAPLSDADLARRRQSALSPRQDAHLVAWGYPYVFDEFRFHMTLSNKLEDEGEREALTRAAERHFAPVTGTPLAVDSFGLYVEPERNAPFTVHTLFSLSGTAGTSSSASPRPAADTPLARTS